MKNLAIVFLIIGSLLLGTNLVNATHNDAKKDRNKTKMVTSTEQVDQIMDLIDSPSIDIKEEAKVVVHFSISEDNIVEVNNVVTENSNIKEYVIQKMNGKRIRGNDIEVKNQSLNLVFKVEKQEVYTQY